MLPLPSFPPLPAGGQRGGAAAHRGRPRRAVPHRRGRRRGRRHRPQRELHLHRRRAAHALFGVAGHRHRHACGQSGGSHVRGGGGRHARAPARGEAREVFVWGGCVACCSWHFASCAACFCALAARGWARLLRVRRLWCSGARLVFLAWRWPGCVWWGGRHRGLGVGCVGSKSTRRPARMPTGQQPLGAPRRAATRWHVPRGAARARSGGSRAAPRRAGDSRAVRPPEHCSPALSPAHALGAAPHAPPHSSSGCAVSRHAISAARRVSMVQTPRHHDRGRRVLPICAAAATGCSLCGAGACGAWFCGPPRRGGPPRPRAARHARGAKRKERGLVCSRELGRAGFGPAAVPPLPRLRCFGARPRPPPAVTLHVAAFTTHSKASCCRPASRPRHRDGAGGLLPDKARAAASSPHALVDGARSWPPRRASRRPPSRGGRAGCGARATMTA